MKIKKNKFYKLISLALAGVLMLSQAVPLIAETVEPVETVEVASTHSAQESMAGSYAFEYEVNEDGTGVTIIRLPNDYQGAVVIPQTIDGLPVTTIGRGAFYECRSLTSIEIPNSVTVIQDYAFYKCKSLTSITIPDSVTNIESYAFEWCVSLENIIIPDSVTSIGKWAFSFCQSLKSITMPANIKSIMYGAFSYCNSLTNITIPDSVTSIDSLAFSNCSSLVSIKIPNSVTRIGGYAFNNCSSLLSIEIPNNVARIESHTFSNCSSLKSIKIPHDITWIAENAFEMTPFLTIYVDFDNQYIKQYAQQNNIPYKIKALQSIEVKTQPAKTNYYVGDTLDTTGLTLTAKMNNSSTQTISSGFTVDTTLLSTAGTQKVTVTYNGKTTSFEVEVINKPTPPTPPTPTPTKPLKPTNTKATALSTEVIKVTWDKVDLADGYEVYRFVNGRSVFYKAFDEDTTSFNNAGKKPNTTYYYKIRSYKVVDGEKLYSGYTDLFTCTTPPTTPTKPLKPTNTKATALSTEVIKVTWDKVSNADGYEVYRFVNGRSVFYKDFKGEDTTSFNNAGKKPNTTYYYKIRSYTNNGGEKLYSGYTDLFTCTTPKK